MDQVYNFSDDNSVCPGEPLACLVGSLQSHHHHSQSHRGNRASRTGLGPIPVSGNRKEGSMRAATKSLLNLSFAKAAPS